MGKILLASLILATGIATATPLPIKTYQLHDNWIHGTHTTGLLLDHAFNGTNSYAFSFDHPGAYVTLAYDGSTIHITGTAYGGMDWGTDFAPASWPQSHLGFYFLDFRYNVGVNPVPGDTGGYQDVQVLGSYNNFGSISGPGGTRYLTDQANSANLAFRFGDGPTGGALTGIGWLAYCASGTDCSKPNHIDFQDWNFRAESAPEPGSALMIVTAVAGLLIVRRKGLI